jgi:hypothetical protein
MENEHVLADLIRKRAEVAAALEEAQSRVRRLTADMESVDATIRMLEPNIDLAAIRPKALPPRHVAHHGEVMQAIFDALRGTGEPLTTNDLTMRVMASRSLNTSDAPLVRTMQKRVGAAMRQLREKGRVRSERLHGGKAGRQLAYP